MVFTDNYHTMLASPTMMRAVARGPYVYRVQYVRPGRSSQTTTYRSETPLSGHDALDDP